VQEMGGQLSPKKSRRLKLLNKWTRIEDCVQHILNKSCTWMQAKKNSLLLPAYMQRLNFLLVILCYIRQAKQKG